MGAFGRKGGGVIERGTERGLANKKKVLVKKGCRTCLYRFIRWGTRQATRRVCPWTKVFMGEKLGFVLSGRPTILPGEIYCKQPSAQPFRSGTPRIAAADSR